MRKMVQRDGVLMASMGKEVICREKRSVITGSKIRSSQWTYQIIGCVVLGHDLLFCFASIEDDSSSFPTTLLDEVLETIE